jgi:predicted ATP-grasp superfamily ATP-dependent carboligase
MIGIEKTIAFSDRPPAFVTYGWCRTSYGVVSSLGRRGITVHVGDASPRAMSRFSKYARSFTRLPDFFTEPERYFESVCRALRRTGAQVLLPGHEDVGIFSRYRDALPAGVRAPLPPFALYEQIEDKWGCIDLARQYGCPAPWTKKISRLDELNGYREYASWPLVLKTRAGNGAKGVRIVHGFTELVDEYRNLIAAFGLFPERWPILQEYLPGRVMGVGVVYHRGRCIAATADRYIRFKDRDLTGTATMREIPEDLGLIDVAVSFFDKLGWHGMAQLEFVPDKNGIPRLNEINARPWGSMALAIHAGVDFPNLWYRAAIDDPPAGGPILPTRDVPCRWLVGEAIAFAQLIKQKNAAAALRILRPLRHCGHDDFHLYDPLPLAFEGLDYLWKMVERGGNFNPITPGQIR